ncbi:hypothetical protein [Bradyrhizobium sp. WSM1253]|uniref:hypothetical protein n=1 Tax=Bradyrhizobium sp. WSM1253 TaxID=319003 RepID=UPI00025D1859|nr:hypothetical protein [Bradyrhizobium sp. WSM1253]EIG56088.1 hypothetical protein Bra1253DRAFT_00696 [Bradyrhizobium sp. WSM1253]
MKRLFASALAFLAFLALLPALAAAQTGPTLPANSVWGRMGVGPGPAQAIPFSVFHSAVSGPCATLTAGLVPATGGGTANFLRADCTFASPLPTILNNQIVANVSGSTGPAAGATPTSIWDSFCSTTIGNFWVRMSSAWGCTSLGYANPVWWGCDPTGVVSCSSAFNSALATNLPVRFPSGTFLLTSQISIAQSSYRSSTNISGAGQNLTKLLWSNASGGIQISTSTSGSTVPISAGTGSISDLTLATNQVNGGTALRLQSSITTVGPTFSIRNVTIQGDDWEPYRGSAYWGIGFYTHLWSYVLLDNVTINGRTALTVGGAALGSAVVIEGDVASTQYVQSIKLTNSNFGSANIAIELRDYWQGVLTDKTNTNGFFGCIYQAPGAAGTLAQFSFINSICGSDGFGASIQSNINDMQVIGSNIIYGPPTGGQGLSLGSSAGAMIVGNNIALVGSPVSNTAINSAGAGAVITGNRIVSATTGVFLSGASSGATVGLNSYNNVTNKIVNSGAGNSVGTQAAGNMAGVVP